MRKYFLNNAVCATWLLVVVAAVGAGEVEKPLDPEQAQFLEQFRSAAQSKDADRIRDLSHTQSRQCVNPDDAPYYDRIIQGMIRVFGHDQKIKNTRYKPTDAEELESAMSRMSKRGMRWPVSPDGRIIVKYEKPGGARVANLHVARDQGRWRWVHICQN